MSKTRFMTALFSATENGDEELTNQVAGDINAAKRNGSFEDDEMSYEDLGDKGVLATDKMNGEQTLIHNEVSEDGTDQWVELSAYPEYCVGDYVHPEINPDGSQVVYAADEIPVENPREFSVATDNQAVLRIFSDQDMVETVAESVYQSEQEAQVGDLKFEKSSDKNGVIVTSLSSGDKAMVELDGPDMRVTELDQKNFKSFSNRSNMNVISRRSFSDEQYEPIFVVALDPVNKVLVNSPVYGEAAAQDLAGQLAELGLVGVNIFADPDQGRDYALALLCNEGVETTDQIGDEEQAEVAYSDQSVICNRYFTDRTRFMNRMFAEAEEEITDHQDVIEDAIEHDEQIETEDYIITPVDEDTAVIEDKDNGEFTVAELDGEDMNVEEISKGEAADMIEDAEEHDYSDYLNYMQRQYADEATKEATEGFFRRMYKRGVGATESLGKKLIGERKEGNLIRKMGEMISKHPKSVLATGSALATAGIGTGAYKGYKYLKNRKARKMEEAANVADVVADQEYPSDEEMMYSNRRMYSDDGGGILSRGLNAAVNATKRLGESMIGDRGEGNVIRKMGKLISENPKASLAVGSTLATAGVGTGVYAGHKAYKKRKARKMEEAAESMYSMNRYYSDDDLTDEYNEPIQEAAPEKEGFIRRKYRAAIEKTQNLGERWSEKDNKAAKKIGEFVKENPRAALALSSLAATAGTIGTAVAGRKLYKKLRGKGKKAVDVVPEETAAQAAAEAAPETASAARDAMTSEYYFSQRGTRMFDDATLAQIEDQATEAIQNVQEAAETAINAIQQAKNEPVDNSSDIQEATYSDRMFSDCKSLDEVW